MPTYVAFLRAVNVGGRFVRMAELRAALTAEGFGEVETHIQSGNLRVTSSRRSPARVEADLETALGAWAGFDVPAMVRTPSRLRAVAQEVAAVEPLVAPAARRYVCFTKSPVVGAAAAAAQAWDAAGERVHVLAGGDVLIELAGPTHEARIGNNRLEKIIKTAATMRDLKVVLALSERWGA